MANSIDFTTLAVGALIGVGCREQIKAASRVAANLASSLATTAAIAVNSAAAEVDSGTRDKADQTQAPVAGQAAGNGQG